MLTIKRFGVFLLLGLLSACLLLIGFSIGFNQTLGSQDKIKATLEESGIYADTAVQIQSQVSKDIVKGTSLNLDQATVNKAVSEVITTNLVKDNMVPMVDSGYSWLRGEVGEPELKVDTRKVQEQIALNIADAAEARVKALPACTYQQLLAINPNNIDIASLNCLPAGLDISRARQQFLTAANSELVTGVVNQVSDGSIIDPQTKTETFDQLRHLPTIFQIIRILPWILAGLLVLSVLLIIKLSPDKKVGLTKLSKRLILAGISLIALIYLGKYVQTAAIDQVGREFGELQQSGVKAVDILASQFYKSLLLVGGAGILLGVLGILVPKCFPKRKA